MAIIYDESTVAALPGRIKVDAKKFVKYYEITGVAQTFFSLAFKLKLNHLNRLFPQNDVIQLWIYLNELFQYGCTNPTVIINKTKGILATYTDLTNDGGPSTPVIKIVQIKSSALKDFKIENGDKAITVAFYERSEDDQNARAWVNFSPFLACLFSNDIAAISNLQSKIKPKLWECLALGLQQIENIEQPGLYYLNLPDSLTKKAY